MNATHDTGSAFDPMMTGHSRPLDLVTIRATVRRALQPRRTPATQNEVEEITLALRSHLALMIPEAEDHANRLNRGSLEWNRRQSLVVLARNALGYDWGNSAQAARLNMTELGRCARFLADCLDE
ncbi:hypothetical protein I5Q34_26855 [Streptomyces sp. AV19]|uniref:DUF6415 family natural product biosynthesis protein n=1 Tax=Streptomyces sp. AV19 TaxID=2793068 RepID=UPI0018FE379A|nr:DUF6415 family natural product biosynthesis protein [Streptomyces sp. AV19]MBH1937847.1 hypothetical protein [Streptomyces sp. AV19]MDG4537125.1 DUF6415 family natural product biosynthesis protein [Streptomyces sp. AV19]